MCIFLETQKSKQKPHGSFLARQFNRVRHNLSHNPSQINSANEEDTNNEQQATELNVESITTQQSCLTIATTCNSSTSGRNNLTELTTLNPTLEIDARLSSFRCLHQPGPLRNSNLQYGGEQLHAHLVSVTQNREYDNIRNDNFINRGNSNGKTYKCPVHNHHGCNKNRTLNNHNEHSRKISGTKSKEPRNTMNPQLGFSKNGIVLRNVSNLTEHSKYFEQRRRYSCPIETIVYLEGSENDVISKSIPKDLEKV